MKLTDLSKADQEKINNIATMEVKQAELRERIKAVVTPLQREIQSLQAAIDHLEESLSQKGQLYLETHNA